MTDNVFDDDVKIDYFRRLNSPQKNKKMNKKKRMCLDAIASETNGKKKKNNNSVLKNQRGTASYYVFGEHTKYMNHSHACQVFNRHHQTKSVDGDSLYEDSDIITAYVQEKVMNNNWPSEKVKPLIEDIFRPSFRELVCNKDMVEPRQSTYNDDHQTLIHDDVNLDTKDDCGYVKEEYKAMDKRVDVQLSCHSSVIAKPIPDSFDAHGSSVSFTQPCYKPISRAVDSRPSGQLLKEDVLPKVKMDWEDYHRLDVIHEFMDDLEREFPALCTVDSIGQSLEGRNLKILRISNSVASNSAVWIDAGIHAREWIGPAVNTFLANYIARNFDSLPEYMTSKDWYFLPVVNPDGYEYSHTQNRMWRKNRAWYSGECVGVDLNRNFSFNWGGRGSSSNPNNCFYRGPEPFSEPESNAIRDFMINSGIKFKVYLTMHSYGQVIIFPFASCDELCADYIRLLQGATIMSKAIYETSGTTYKVGVSKDVMYRASGTSNDWCYGSVGIPYCYLLELRSKKHKFKLPKEEIHATGNEILSCVIRLMEFVDNNDCEYKYQQRKRFIS